MLICGWHADNLFGTCQSRSHVDGYQYRLNSDQLSQLYDIVQRLVVDGYTWHHRHTQCMLYAALSRFRQGSVVIPTVCADEAKVSNTSRPDIPPASPYVKSSLSRNYDKAFSDFQKFMQGLEAEDLFALKHFLLEHLSSKRPLLVRTVPGRVRPHDEDRPAAGTDTFF